MRQFGPTESFLLKTGSVHLKAEPGGEDVCSFSGLQKLFFLAFFINTTELQRLTD